MPHFSYTYRPCAYHAEHLHAVGIACIYVRIRAHPTRALQTSGASIQNSVGHLISYQIQPYIAIIWRQRSHTQDTTSRRLVGGDCANTARFAVTEHCTGLWGTHSCIRVCVQKTLVLHGIVRLRLTVTNQRMYDLWCGTDIVIRQFTLLFF